MIDVRQTGVRWTAAIAAADGLHGQRTPAGQKQYVCMHLGWQGTKSTRRVSVA